MDRRTVLRMAGKVPKAVEELRTENQYQLAVRSPRLPRLPRPPAQKIVNRLLELPDQPTGDAAEIGGQAGNPIRNNTRIGALKRKIGVLKAAVYPPGDAPGKRCVHSAAGESDN